MHTAEITKLPVLPTSDVARPESHGKDFSRHLREDARQNARSDRPQSSDHDERCCRNERPRAPEEDNRRVSSDDRSEPVERSEKPGQASASENNAELPDAGAEAPDGNTALAAAEPATSLPEKQAPLPGTVAGNTGSTTVTAETGAPASTVAAETRPEHEQADAAVAKTTETGATTETRAPVPDGDGIIRDPQPVAAQDATDVATKPGSQQVEMSSVTDKAASPMNAAAEAETPQAAAQASGATAPSSPERPATNPTATQTTVAATAVRGPGGMAADAGNDAADGDGDAEVIDGLNRKPAGTAAVAAQATGSAHASAANGTSAEAAATGDAGARELPALKDLAARAGESPAQPNTTAPGQNGANSSAAAFGSELKLAGEASPTTETAAARNTPNGAANQVAVQINRAVQEGQDKFTVNLKPGNLGKVSVQLEVGHDNRIIAVISAERPETLELLQRDARTLELALKDAGLKSDSGSLNFSLQGNGADDTPHDDPSGKNHNFAFSHNGDDPDDFVSSHHPAHILDASGVDIHV